ncbi:cytochrome c biogenesis protein CcdA [Desulfovermiculus halophilus]|jgi:thiol:disulfide interchange protein DsbD|uniref:cytochrome c biogenesis protein CcdA n=1 Tax=Desulfovermiculus halophilus TaxID=339722 RepID=UPI0006849B71|nr:cytochrome c biogenesis protein CcdA [Desulfovermiculus halophilus]
MLELTGSMQAALDSSLIMAAGISFLAGFLASLTPCVYPLLPVVVTCVSSSTVHTSSRWRAFSASLAYVCGLTAVYAGLGMIAALSGSFFGSVSTNPWAQFIVANIFILLGLNTLEVIPLPLLSLSGRGAERQERGLLGAFTLGAASGLVASPCTAPVLGIILTYVGSTQNVISGGILLIFFSLGLSLILLAAGTFTGLLTTLPRPGNWMNWIKKGLGLAMIGLGEYFLIQAGRLMF